MEGVILERAKFDLAKFADTKRRCHLGMIFPNTPVPSPCPPNNQGRLSQTPYFLWTVPKAFAEQRSILAEGVDVVFDVWSAAGMHYGCTYKVSEQMLGKAVGTWKAMLAAMGGVWWQVVLLLFASYLEFRTTFV